MVSLIIKNVHIVTPIAKGMRIIEDGSIAINGNEIIRVGHTSEITRDFAGDKEIDAQGQVGLPGLIDSHIHSPLSLLRGLAQDVPESEWMHKTMDPISRHLSDDMSIIGSKLAVIEGLKSGTTSFCDYGYNMDRIVEEVYSTIGVRANVCSTINELGPTRRSARELYQFDKGIGEEKLQKAIQLIEEKHGTNNGSITCLLGPQAADMMSENLLKEVLGHAKDKGVKIHMHVAQGGRERSQMTKRYGASTIAFLKGIDYLGEHLIAVHCHNATSDELKMLAQSGANMVACPGSIGFIDGMTPPIHEFQSYGGTVGIGSDQCPPAGHNLLTQMKYAAILNKTLFRNPAILPAHRTLRLATIDGAKCHGLHDRIGSIEAGKRADITLMDLNRPHLTPIVTKPIRNIIPNIVYHALGNEVTTVIVDGQIIMRDGVLQTIDEERTCRDAQRVAEKLGLEADKDFKDAGSLLAKVMQEGFL